MNETYIELKASLINLTKRIYQRILADLREAPAHRWFDFKFISGGLCGALLRF